MSSSVEKILLFRSGPAFLFEEAIKQLKSNDPSCHIDVYVPEALVPLVADREDIDRYFSTNWEGMFTKASITSELVRQFKQQNYTKLVILYNNPYGEGYGALRRLAFRIRPPRVMAFSINRTWSHLKREGILGRYLLPHRWAYNAITIVFSLEIILTTLWDMLLYKLGRFSTQRMPLPERKPIGKKRS